MTDFDREAESGSIYLTAVAPFGPDIATRYPFLAIMTRYSAMSQRRIGVRPRASWLGALPLDGIQICAKYTYLLTADADGRFKWVSPHQSRLYQPQLGAASKPEGRKGRTRYSIQQENLEDSNVIYPLRPFSITKVEMDGFDPDKAYPVLAIDTDKYLPEEEPDEAKPEGPQTETMAFFLVGDDSGEFVWVAEDECRLQPLTE